MFSRRVFFSWIWNEPNTPEGRFLMEVQRKGVGALRFPRFKGGNTYVEEFRAQAKPSDPLWLAALNYFRSLRWDHPIRVAFSRRSTPGLKFGVIMPPDWREVGPVIPSNQLIAEIEAAAGMNFVSATVAEAFEVFD